MIFVRGVVTDALIAAVSGVGYPVGDAEAPPGGGWVGDVNAPGTTFIPYVVITPLNTSGGRGPLGDSEGDWVLPYALTYFGLSRKQVEALADKGRQSADALARQRFQLDVTTELVVQKVIPSTIGGVTRVTSVEPNYYMQSDVVSLWTSK